MCDDDEGVVNLSLTPCMEEEIVLTGTAVTDTSVDTEDIETDLCEMNCNSIPENKIPLRHRDASSKSSINSEANPVHRVYMIRWLMLVAMIVLNISNGMVRTSNTHILIYIFIDNRRG